MGYGFDNIGDVLSLPPILFEKYMSAAEKIAEAAIVLDEPDRGKLTSIKPGALPESAGGSKYHADARVLATVGEIVVPYEVTSAGDYYLVARAGQTRPAKNPRHGISSRRQDCQTVPRAANRERAGPIRGENPHRSRQAQGCSCVSQ